MTLKTGVMAAKKISFVSQEQITFENILSWKTIVIIFTILLFLLYFDQINDALVSIRDFFQIAKILPTPKLYL